LTLSDVAFDPACVRPPPHVRRFLRAAGRRVLCAQLRHRVAAFVSSDFGLAYSALTALSEGALPAGDRMCEWGSGMGVVCCLAEMTGFRACGIEARRCLVKGARRLAADFDLPAEFACGSFVPREQRTRLLAGRAFGSLSRGGRCGHEALGAAADEFDLIYAYPWPDEEDLVADLFDACARTGALLLSYHGAGEMRLRRRGGPAG
jgi:hypothetical protein